MMTIFIFSLVCLYDSICFITSDLIVSIALSALFFIFWTPFGRPEGSYEFTAVRLCVRNQSSQGFGLFKKIESLVLSGNDLK